MKPELEKGDKVLFNDRKTPLTVIEASEKVLVEGPNGGRYEIFYDNDTLLVARPGKRDYASYCNELRKVGKWIREEDMWEHSKTGAKIELQKNEAGFWTLVSDVEVDVPKYGFSNREAAVEEAEKAVEGHPEG